MFLIVLIQWYMHIKKKCLSRTSVAQTLISRNEIGIPWFQTFGVFIKHFINVLSFFLLCIYFCIDVVPNYIFPYPNYQSYNK